MSIDVFGRALSKRAGRIPGPPGPQGRSGIGFTLTEDENYDMSLKILHNVGEAREKNDAVNLSTVERMIDEALQPIVEHLKPLDEELKVVSIDVNRHEQVQLAHSIVLERQLGVGFLLTADGDYDVASKTLRNVGEPRGKTDAVSLGTVERLTMEILQIILGHLNPLKDNFKQLNARINVLETKIKEQSNV